MLKDTAQSLLRKALVTGAIVSRVLFGGAGSLSAQEKHISADKYSENSFFRNDSTVLIDDYPARPTLRQQFLMNMIEMGNHSKPVKQITDTLKAYNIPFIADTSSENSGAYVSADKTKNSYVSVKKLDGNFNYVHVNAYDFDTHLEEIIHAFDDKGYKIDLSAESLNLTPADYYRYKYFLEASAKAEKAVFFLDAVMQMKIPLKDIMIWQNYKKMSPEYREAAELLENAISRPGDTRENVVRATAEIFFKHFSVRESEVRSGFHSSYQVYYRKMYKHDPLRPTGVLTDSILRRFGEMPGFEGYNYLDGFKTLSGPAFCMFDNTEWTGIDSLNRVYFGTPAERNPLSVGGNNVFWFSDAAVPVMKAEWEKDIRRRKSEIEVVRNFKDEIIAAIEKKQKKVESEKNKSITRGNEAASDSLKIEYLKLGLMLEEVGAICSRKPHEPEFSIRRAMKDDFLKFDFVYDVNRVFKRDKPVSESFYKIENGEQVFTKLKMFKNITDF